jgi:hypothetical protein
MEDEDSYLHKKTILVIARRSGEAGSTWQSLHSNGKVEIATPCPRRSRGQTGARNDKRFFFLSQCFCVNLFPKMI